MGIQIRRKFAGVGALSKTLSPSLSHTLSDAGYGQYRQKTSHIMRCGWTCQSADPDDHYWGGGDLTNFAGTNLGIISSLDTDNNTVRRFGHVLYTNTTTPDPIGGSGTSQVKFEGTVTPRWNVKNITSNNVVTSGSGSDGRSGADWLPDGIYIIDVVPVINSISKGAISITETTHIGKLDSHGAHVPGTVMTVVLQCSWDSGYLASQAVADAWTCYTTDIAISTLTGFGLSNVCTLDDDGVFYQCIGDSFTRRDGFPPPGYVGCVGDFPSGPPGFNPAYCWGFGIAHVGGLSGGISYDGTTVSGYFGTQPTQTVTPENYEFHGVDIGTSSDPGTYKVWAVAIGLDYGTVSVVETDTALNSHGEPKIMEPDGSLIQWVAQWPAFAPADGSFEQHL